MVAVCTPLDQRLSEYSPQWTDFGRLLGDIAMALAALDPTTVWPIEGASGTTIGQVSLADFVHKFGNITWTLTDKNYSALNGGVGEVLSQFQAKVWESAAEEIRASDFAVYMAWPQRQGATYLALHETAHTTELGLQLNSMLYDQFIHLGGAAGSYSKSAQWLYNEAAANLIALEVADAIGFPMLPHPTGGFANAIARPEPV
jgi:hypothetical protein